MNSNENQIQVEVLQPEINNQIHRTTLEELREWIRDGKLQPNHQVRIKNLSWVEAQKIPAFQALFEAKRNDRTEQPNHSYSQTLTVASEPVKPQIAEEKPFPKTGFFSLRKESDSSGKEKPAAETSGESEPKTAEPSVVFQAFEKKFLTKEKQITNKTESSEDSLEPQKKSPFRKKNSLTAKNKSSLSQNKNSILTRIFVFVAGCLLAGLLAYGGSYLWVYQLKTPEQIDEKSLPEIASLEDRLTSDKLGLRLKEEARKQELKDSGNQENPAPHQGISQQMAQLEKQFDVQRKAVIENHKIRFQRTDFDMTFSFSLVVLLVVFVFIRVFYDKKSQPTANKKSSKLRAEPKSEFDDFQDENEQKTEAEQKIEAEKIAAENEAVNEPDSTEFQT